jgi:hypothetical protein
VAGSGVAGLSDLYCPVDESVPEDSVKKRTMIEVAMDQTVVLVLVAADLVEGEEGSLVVWSEWLQKQCAIADSSTEQRPSKVMEMAHTRVISTNTTSSKVTHKRSEQAQEVLIDQAEADRLGSRNFLRRYVSLPVFF